MTDEVLAAPPDETAAPADDYWSQSRRPLVSLAFTVPLLAAYESGLLLLGPHAVRNGADALLRQLLEWIGFGQYFLLPVLTVSVLLAWHYTLRQSWRLPQGVFWGMAAECLLLAYGLRLVLLLQGAVFHDAALDAQTNVAVSATATRLGQAVGFLGAGIYEELLFRLMLMPLMAWGLRQMGVSHSRAVLAAALGTSLIFSAAHYVGPYGDPLDAFSFTFRFLAGLFFAALFAYRGFGIAAGTHAGYDLVVGLLRV